MKYLVNVFRSCGSDLKRPNLTPHSDIRTSSLMTMTRATALAADFTFRNSLAQSERKRVTFAAVREFREGENELKLRLVKGDSGPPSIVAG